MFLGRHDATARTRLRKPGSRVTREADQKADPRQRPPKKGRVQEGWMIYQHRGTNVLTVIDGKRSPKVKLRQTKVACRNREEVPRRVIVEGNPHRQDQARARFESERDWIKSG